MDKLKNSFKKTTHKLANHGPRNVSVLQEAIAAVPPETESDIYGEGSLITDFQNKIATFLGTESAVFFPSGTMAQQIALRIWSDRKKNKRVAYHPLCHIEIHEADGLKEIHHIQPLLLGEANRLLTLDDIKNLPKTVACILIELPQREIGGQLPSFSELEAISNYCREHDIALHLDGARLWEVQPYYGKSAKEICALFDTIYVSFYKGIGGIAGAVLAGPTDFTTESKVWKRRYGGNLISLSPYILAADHYFDQRIEKMPLYYETAKQLAQRFNACSGVRTVPEIPVSNMFHVYFEGPSTDIAPILTQLHETSHIGVSGYLRDADNNNCYFELSVGDCLQEIPAGELGDLFQHLDVALKSL